MQQLHARQTCYITVLIGYTSSRAPLVSRLPVPRGQSQGVGRLVSCLQSLGKRSLPGWSLAEFGSLRTVASRKAVSPCDYQLWPLSQLLKALTFIPSHLAPPSLAMMSQLSLCSSLLLTSQRKLSGHIRPTVGLFRSEGQPCHMIHSIT